MNQLGYVPLLTGYSGYTLGKIYWDIGGSVFIDDDNARRHIWLNAVHTTSILMGEDIEISDCSTDDIV